MTDDKRERHSFFEGCGGEKGGCRALRCDAKGCMVTEQGDLVEGDDEMDGDYDRDM